MKVVLWVAVTVALTGLSGCKTLEKYAREAKLRAINEAKQTCTDFGFQTQTSEHAKCVQQEIHHKQKMELLEQRHKEQQNKLAVFENKLKELESEKKTKN